jgi:hypothetical protein
MIGIRCIVLVFFNLYVLRVYGLSIADERLAARANPNVTVLVTFDNWETHI